MVSKADLDRLARIRGRVALGLTAAMLVAYFGFILLVAYDRELLGERIVPGLSIGIALGALVIAFAWALTGIYVRWARTRWDAEIAALRPRTDLASVPIALELEADVTDAAPEVVR